MNDTASLPREVLAAYIEGLGIDPKKLDTDARKAIDQYIRYRVNGEAQTVRAATEVRDIVPGDVVLLKSVADLPMTIRTIGEREAVCNWYNVNFELMSAAIPLTSLFILRCWGKEDDKAI